VAQKKIWRLVNSEVRSARRGRRFEGGTWRIRRRDGISPAGEFVSLGEIKQPNGKVVIAWAFGGDCTPAIRSNTFSMEWPSKSGRTQEFPEVDRAGWFSVNDARNRIHRGKIGFLDELIARFR
jgi:predicted NUDIX family NTP pyrophosphohydrolase